MSAQPDPIRRAAVERRDQVRGPIVGTFLGINLERQALVRFSGAPRSVMVARIATHDPAFSGAIDKLRGRSVLLAFEANERTSPLIVGIVRDAFELPSDARPDVGPAVHDVGEPGQPLRINGRSLVFEGQEEIQFRCGRGSITIREDGSIVVKGTRLLSRASEVNKIRGASVQIN
jgi:hypothetical protein